MAIEIEKKYLVSSIPAFVVTHPYKEVLQGYITGEGDSTEVRLRKIDEELFLTIKIGSGVLRNEFEYPVTKEQFSYFWQATAGKRIQKRRYYLEKDDVTIEVDLYSGNLEGLVTAEIEFDNREVCKRFKPLDWMGPEITEKDEYKNKNLALYGLSAH